MALDMRDIWVRPNGSFPQSFEFNSSEYSPSEMIDDFQLIEVSDLSLSRNLWIRIKSEEGYFIAIDTLTGRRGVDRRREEALSLLLLSLRQLYHAVFDREQRLSPEEIRDLASLREAVSDPEWIAEYEALVDTLEIMDDADMMTTLWNSNRQAAEGELIDLEEAEKRLDLSD